MDGKGDMKGPSRLVVDIDGTLLRGDLFWEGLVNLLRANPLCVFGAVLRLILKGRAVAKAYVAGVSGLDPRSLPVSRAAMELIERERARGVRIILASGCHEGQASELGRKIGADEVVASCGSVNLTGRKKLSALKDRFHEFDYAGDSIKDIPLWKAAGKAYVVNPGLLTRVAVKRARPDALILLDDDFVVRAASVFRLFRVHQWSKNLLILLPLITSHKIFKLSLPNILLLLQGFLSFSFLASAIYILNDLFDLPHDRNHPVKHKRPIASGAIGIPFAVLLAALSLALSVAFAHGLPADYKALLVLYLVITSAYSVYLKKKVIIDVITLGVLYTLRTFAGAVLIAVPISRWFMVFFLFTFFSLSLIKRCADLIRQGKKEDGGSGREYIFEDYNQLARLGTSSSLVASLVFCLFVIDPEISRNYSRPEVLWLALPLLIYEFSRLWLLTDQGKVDSDPVVFMLKDAPSYMVLALFGAIIYAAI